MKKYLIFAASALALTSCSSDDFLGENPGNVQNATSAINFGGEAGKITRATSNEGSTEKMLDGQFKVYGVKRVGDGTPTHVFNDYKVWYVADGKTTTNKSGWEYVGANGASNLGTGNITLAKDQTIKYWDYSAKDYLFVAGSPIDAFSFNVGTDHYISSATVTGFAGHINANNTTTALKTDPVYIADPVKVVKDDYKDPVTFSFKRQQSMVRVGFYETIPGYNIHNINFYYYDTDGTPLKVSDGNNIILTSATADYFVGGSNIGGTVNYDWTAANPSYTFEYTDNLIKSKNWYAGKLDVLATTSSETDIKKLYGTDKDMSATTGYFTVLPTQVATASPILIKCDYTLFDENTGETIKVTGATAAIPAAFSKWEANTRYTYLFKISDNTNGTTGTPGTDPAGLFPITFAASVTETLDKTDGTITTVATPSITTHQAGSVTENSIEYKTGKEIDVTVTDAETGEVKALNTDGATVGSVAVYKFTDAITEAELQVKGTAGATTVTGTVADNVLTFTPNEEGYYAIKYLTTAATTTDPAKPAAYTYKVVYVKAAPTVTPIP